MGIFRGTGGTGDSTTDTTVTTVTEKAAEAASSATSAANSATSAANSASSASTSETNAATSESNAATSASNASSSETNAATSASQAATSATNSASSATASASSASSASTSATNAATSATSAQTAETNAETAETNAETAYANTLAIFGDATDVQNAVDDAEKLAINPEDSQYTLSDAVTTGYSALHYAAKAEDYKTAAEVSKNAAETAETAAETAQGLAETAQTAAETAQSAAETAQAAAELAQSNAETVYDNFDDRYLGNKSGDPLVDNDNDGLTTGTLYFNTTENEMRVYTGTAWEPVQELSGDQTVNSLTSNNDVVVKGNLEVQGTTITVDSATAQTIDLGDNDKIRLGDSDDLQIYHDGNHSRIDDTGTGNLILRASSDIYLGNLSGEVYIRATENGAVQLRHDNAEKLATTSTGVDVTGNITVSGTVDGRDVATDGSKLDGIEENADVTDTANVTAAGALMDSEVTNLAQVKAFDSADYATAAQGTTADNALPTAGGTLTGDLAFGDNVKAKFGASDDLQIFHDGSASVISEQGTGSLIVKTSAFSLQNAAGSEFMGIASENSGVYLYFDGSQKLQTTSSGVDITGTVVADGLTVNNSSSVIAQFGRDGSDGDVVQIYNGATGTTKALAFGVSGTSGVIESQFGGIDIKAGSTLAARFSSGNDISFYEDTGTTAKLTWDASVEDLQFKDNVAAEFGDGGDLRIYHTGSSSYIADASGAGFINIRSNAVRLASADGSEILADFIQNGAVTLYYDNSAKLATTSTGIDVTGTVTADGLTVEQATSPTITINDTDSVLPLTITQDGANGSILLGSAGALTLGVTNNSSSDALNFQTKSTTRINIASTGDISFYDDAGTSQDFYWDASTSRLGLGTTSPTAELDVAGTITSEQALLSAIDATISDTAVDVFVYDTRKDSDGGAWRKRTQHTSWYNETLNTSTRGSRKEFPAVAVIVAEADRVTIYDGDDPDMPMWMVFAATSVGFINTTNSVKAVVALNGKLLRADNRGTSVGYGAGLADFISDTMRLYTNSPITNRLASEPISSRNSWAFYNTGTEAEGQIVHPYANDVAMTVLPNAPIDEATGLPIPTIAVATDGGVSVIKDDGSVVDSAETGAASFVNVDSDGIWYGRSSLTFYSTYADAQSDGFGDAVSSTFSGQDFDSLVAFQEFAKSPNVLAAGGRIETGNLPALPGLMLHQPNYTDFTKGMSVLTTSTYNTGWMNGDIKGAFLSDTDDTDVVESTVYSEAFDSAGSWTLGTGATISGGVLSYTGGSGATDSYTINVFPSNSQCIVTFTVLNYTSGDVKVRPGSTNEGSTVSANGTYSQNVSSSSNATIVIDVSSDFVGDIDNISVRLAEEDRSVNGNGLQVFGTITKDPVATGADLVAYSGFSTSNYLEQPYNSDLDFGTGDFCVMGWVNGNISGDIILQRRGASDAGQLYLFGSSGGLMSVRLGSTTLTSTQTFTSGLNFFTVVRRSGVVEIYLSGVLDTSGANAEDLSAATTPTLRIGKGVSVSAPLSVASLALLRISATAPTAEQIKKIYEDEKVLFQDNAQATLYGSSDAVTALAYDEDTELLHVGTSAGRSVFQGLRRVDNTTDAVGSTISASNGMVVED